MPTLKMSVASCCRQLRRSIAQQYSSAAARTDYPIPIFRALDSLSEWQSIAPRRYWLIRQETDDKGALKQLPSPDHARRLYPVAFGSTYDDLVPLLRRLAPSPLTADPDTRIKCINEHEPQPEIFGRDAEVETVVTALLAGRPAIVAGGPGMGKTAVATVALYDLRVVSKFGRRRIFASLGRQSRTQFWQSS